MPHIADPFGLTQQIGHGGFSRGALTGVGPVPPPSMRTSIIGIPSPGDFDIGGTISGLITQILGRFPIPRPRLPGPRVPGRIPRGRIPIPIPIPIPTGLFGGGEECPTCCKGFHIAKTKNEDDPSFGQCVRNRRMNPLNPRALRRAVRRATRFEAFVKANRMSLRKLAKI